MTSAASLLAVMLASVSGCAPGVVPAIRHPVERAGVPVQSHIDPATIKKLNAADREIRDLRYKLPMRQDSTPDTP